MRFFFVWTFVVVSSAVFVGCGQDKSVARSVSGTRAPASVEAPASPATAIRLVLAEDMRLSAIRMGAGGDGDSYGRLPDVTAIRTYVRAAKKIELAGTPPAFRDALERHFAAWTALEEGVSAVKSEEDFWARTRAEHKLEPLILRVEGTWNETKAIAMKYDVTVPE